MPEKWNKYLEKNPEKNGKYLIIHEFMGRKEVEIARYASDLSEVDEYDFPKTKYNKKPGWFKLDSEVGYYEINGVTYWQELPDIPEAKNDDKYKMAFEKERNWIADELEKHNDNDPLSTNLKMYLLDERKRLNTWLREVTNQ